MLMKKKILLVVAIVLIVIQFIHPTKNQQANILDSDITKVRSVPEDVQQLLKTACYDCHSNNTVYPWYNNIQPVAWWLNKHVNNGKKQLNFSEFGAYDEKKAKHKLHELVETLEKNEMPLFSYTIIHKDAKLNDAQKKIIIDWAKANQ